MRIRRALVVVGTILATMGVLAPNAQALPDGFYSLPYSSALYQHSHQYQLTFEASFDSWRRAGFPTPRPAPTDIVKYPWADEIYAVTFFEDGWLWRHLTGDEWARTGYAAARSAGWIDGTVVYKYENSPEIFASQSYSGKAHKLTLPEWLSMGQPQPESRHGGYVNLTWAPAGIAQICSFADNCSYQLTLGDWAQAGYPTPQPRTMLPGDQVCTGFTAGSLRYNGSTYYGPLTYSQWAATGFAPATC